MQDRAWQASGQGWGLDAVSFHRFGFSTNGWWCPPSVLPGQLSSSHEALLSACSLCLFPAAFQPLQPYGLFLLAVVPGGHILYISSAIKCFSSAAHQVNPGFLWCLLQCFCVQAPGTELVPVVSHHPPAPASPATACTHLNLQH